MPDMSSHFHEAIAVLREARELVAAEMAQLVEGQLDRRSLVVLDQAVRNFADQADALIVMMAEEDAPDASVDAADELVDFFQEARERIESMLALGRG